uniref:Uncharacterized protein n=1 Tax=Anguilla anguilla TaxID=7936 RepID=A0A0E9R4Y8_ANGAN
MLINYWVPCNWSKPLIQILGRE